ncbi:MacS family sensor histidine kinase [Amycolatopsis sp. NPDC003865]
MTPARTPDPITPMWRGVLAFRVLTWAFAFGTVIVQSGHYQREWLAWTVLGVMAAWSVVSSFLYLRERTRPPALVVFDLVLTTALLLTSPWVLSDAQFALNVPLITTVWAAVPPVAAGARFGAGGGVLAGLVVGVATGLAREKFDLDVARDGVLLAGAGLLVGMAATMGRRSAARLEQALRKEAATAERERLARSIHDSVLQVLARVRKRGNEVGGEAAELAKLAGEQEIALRSLVTTEPLTPNDRGTASLRAALQLLATSSVQVSTPADDVELPAHVTGELVAITREALSNVEKHAGPEARAWVLLEDLGGEVVISVRDDGPGIPDGVLERAAADGHLGVVESIRGRVRDLGGSATLDTGPGRGTEWEVRVPSTRGAR